MKNKAKRFPHLSKEFLLSQDRNIQMICFYNGVETGRVMIKEGTIGPDREWYARIAGIKKLNDFTLSYPGQPDKERLRFSKTGMTKEYKKRLEYLSRHNNFVHTIK